MQTPSPHTPDSPDGPLAGIRVLEFGHVAAAPFAGMLLADLGADVVKLESPGGDQMRQWPPLERDAVGEVFSHNFASLNRNKRSVSLDLKSDRGLRECRDLVRSCDVVVENFRPGVLARLGLGFDDVTADHRGLVYCSISGFGARAAGAPGAYDVVVQAASGLMSVTGEAGGPPVKCGVPVGDFVTGLYASFSIVAALPAARVSGESTYLDCSMRDCLLGISALQTSQFWGTGVVPDRFGSAHPRNAPYQAFRAQDTEFVVAAGNDGLWRRVTEVVGRPELADRSEYATQEKRAAHQRSLAEDLEASFCREDAAFWLQRLSAVGVPCSAIQDYGQVLGDLTRSDDDLVVDLPAPVIGHTPAIGFPVRRNHAREPVRRPPPLLGEHTERVLAEWLS